jgi:hypothetical protein
VVFHALDRGNIEAIAKIQLKVLETRMEKMDMKLDVSPQALAELAKAGFDPVFGARPLKRAIQQRIENPVAKLILEGKFGPKDVVPVDVSAASCSSACPLTHRPPRIDGEKSTLCIFESRHPSLNFRPTAGGLLTKQHSGGDS